MDAQQLERLKLMLEQLEPEIPSMKGASVGFVQDQIERLRIYDARMTLSEKQRAWLEDLYVKFVGPLDGLEGYKLKPLTKVNPATGADETDDELPF